MDRPYVDWVRVEGYRCIKRVDVHLTPLHAFIGPNDSGKSSLLQAVASGNATLWVRNISAGVGPHGYMVGSYPQTKPALNANHLGASLGAVSTATDVKRALRLDPDELRKPVSLIARNEPMWFRTERGLGLASLYDALLNRDRAGFTAIDERFRLLFPTVKALRLENADQNTKTMGITLLDGTDVGPEAMSEGMLYWLAFAVVEYISPAGMLLVEEPENGLHPARIAEVLKVLREVSIKTQIILATHSPLVINELKPDEVTIVTRTPERGTICTAMTATKNFAERSKVYALGELWLSYADGNLERELVEPDGPSEAAKAG